MRVQSDVVYMKQALGKMLIQPRSYTYYVVAPAKLGDPAQSSGVKDLMIRLGKSQVQQLANATNDQATTTIYDICKIGNICKSTADVSVLSVTSSYQDTSSSSPADTSDFVRSLDKITTVKGFSKVVDIQDTSLGFARLDASSTKEPYKSWGDMYLQYLPKVKVGK